MTPPYPPKESKQILGLNTATSGQSLPTAVMTSGSMTDLMMEQVQVPRVQTTSGSNIIHGVIVGKSVEDVYKSSDPSVKLLTGNTYDFSQLTSEIQKTSESTRTPSIFVLPNTSVSITYNDGTSRIVTNKSTKNDVIHVEGTHIKNISISIVTDLIQNPQSVAQPDGASGQTKEGFDIDCRSVTFTYYDIFVLLLVFMILYYVYGQKQNE